MIEIKAPEGTEYFKQDTEADAWKAWRLMQDAFAWSSRTTGRDFELRLLNRDRKQVERIVWDQEWREEMDEFERINEKRLRNERIRARRRGER